MPAHRGGQNMKKFGLPDSEQLKRRAHQCRVIAACLRGLETQQRLLTIADEYELLAQRPSSNGYDERRRALPRRAWSGPGQRVVRIV